jgi:hypothetical protein
MVALGEQESPVTYVVLIFTAAIFLGAMRWPAGRITWPGVALCAVNCLALVALLALASWLHAGVTP